ncbi:MAG: M23 family metallopeptidase [Planctomycetes bacterium]|nr:M23 family metallopeptidase [Planctomycetota bacterium]
MDDDVISVSDSLNGCGCDGAYGPCANVVQIRHANGEISTYLHIQRNSATNLGITNGTHVFQGTPIGIDGEVGWTCGNDDNPRSSSCTPIIPPTAGKCGLHLHWVVSRESNGERVNPMTCGIGKNIYANDSGYYATACYGNQCPTNNFVPPGNYSGFGLFRVIQANASISTTAVSVSNFASMVLHPENHVDLLSGFHAKGPGYFRAEIGSCDNTAFVPPAELAATASETNGPRWDPGEDQSGN